LPYTYIWSNAATTQDISNLAAGNYTVTVTDNHSCTATRTATITQPSFPISINATVADVTCNGLNNGSITISASNGAGAYTYNWGNGVTTQNRTGLAAGNYAVTVTDANGCTASSAFTVNQPAPVAITAAVTNATCNGSATGSISLSVTGGFAPYTYGWNGGSNAQVRNGLAAGTYTVTVTDNHSCQATATETITQQTAINITATASNVTCNGLNNGTITTTASGGAGGYSYDWGAGFNTPNRTNLSAGTYVLTVTDNLSCTATSSTTITQPAAIAVSSVNTNVSCNGGNNGAITLAVSGGATPYGYNWVGGAITPNRTNLTAGTYTVTVTDNNSCSVSFTTTITQSAAIALSTTAINVACNGGATGSISVSATGGTGAYSYSWSNGPATAINNNLIAGTYTVTVRDANLCSASASAGITQPTAITTAIASTNISCNGQTNGSIDLTVTGGTGAYTYIWSNGPTTRDISSLAAGTYTVTVKDAANCQVTTNATITQPAAISLSTSTINGGCNGSASGSIDLTVSGGTTNYTYLWSNSALTQDIAGLAANTYSVTVTDANACQATTSATITQPAVLSVTETHTNILCNAATTGTITTTTTGGSIPYNFNWGNNITTPNRTGLAAGLYTVTVTDNASCTATVSAAITQPTAITLASTKTDVQCNASATGAIDLTVSGGTGTYGYHWSNNATSQDISGVTAGNYTVTVNDANACTASASATITQPSPITVSFTLTNVSCYGGSNGAVTTTISGGNGGYTYSWSNNTSNPAITNVPAGNYNLQIKDVTNCVANLSFNITQPSQIVAAETHSSITCNGANNGSVDLSVSGGSPIYVYHWGNNASTQDLTGLASGIYSVTITDAASCTATVNNINITEPAAIALSTVATDVVCSGSGSGAVDLTVTGGTMPYSYHWSNNAITQDLSGVGAGNYQVSVTDANNCQAQTAALVNQATGMQVTLATTPVNCFGATNGSVTTTVAGGSGSYMYNWSNNATSANLSNVAAATYTVTVHDAQNCTGVATATVTQPVAINIAETHTNVNCNGTATGTINTTVSGGAGNYIYQWSNNAGTASLTNLAAANYTLTVTDANACTAIKAVVIAQPTAIILAETHKPYACGNNAGAIDLTVAGGTQPYTYNWTGGLASQDLNNLIAGNYQVTVTDAANCAANLSVAIAQLQPLSISLASTDVTCNGGNNGALNVIALGGTAPYTYSWSNGATTASVANVSAAHYRVLVTDANTCRAADSTTINQPAAIQVSTNVHDISCYGLADGSITVAVSGGAGGYTYNWNTTANTAAISNLIGGNYLLTVTDSRGCTNTATNVPVSEPQPLAIASSVAAIGCAGHNDGQVMLQVSGGVVPYSYKWNNNSAAQNLQNIAAGNYDVTVTDSHGCEANGAYVIGQAPALVVTPAVVNTPCQSVSKGAISLAVSGGNAGYRYSWSNGNTTNAISNVAEGAYAVTITDARNCTVQQSFTIASDYVLEVNATESATIDLGETVQLTAVASTDHNNTYSWTAANSVLCNTCAATETSPMQNTEYLVTVIDANGCKATDALTITVNSAIDIFVPNAFSPNGDGNNDFFQLFGDLGTIAYLDMMVFNRWGEKVFESNNANFTWDGTYKGEVVPQGVFVYTGKIVFINGTSRQLKGSLTVIR
jgi:gliding motility-associated-like protein